MSVQELMPQVQYVSDAEGNPVSVIVPIAAWREIEQEIRSERETAYLLGSEAMRKRLLEALEAKERSEGLSLEEVRAQLGV